MCLLDRVIAWDEQSILCTSETHRDPANPLRRDRHLAALHAFEYGAQAVAVHGGLRARVAGATAPPGYLAALREAILHAHRLDDFPGPLQIQAERLFADKANSVYECRVSSCDVPVATGRVTIILRSPSTTTPDQFQAEARAPSSPARHGQDARGTVIPLHHPSLPGHFPGEPIVPGVVILDEVVAALAKASRDCVTISQIVTVKFLGRLNPEEVFAISFSDAGTQIGFQCRAGERLIAEGRLELTSHD